MADLSVEQIRQLARGFLTGSAEPKELETLSTVLEEDPQMGLELLTQMQTALDETAPTQLSPDQWKSIDEKVEALFAPLASSGGGFNLFELIKGFFSGGSKSKAAKVKGRRKIEELEMEDDVLPMPDVETAPGLPSDDMAPIVPAAADAQASSEPTAKTAAVGTEVENSGEMAPIAPMPEGDPLSAAVDQALDKDKGKTKKKKTPLSAAAKKKWIVAVSLLCAAALLAGSGWYAWQRWEKTKFAIKVKVKPKPKVRPKPRVKPKPKVIYPSRGVFVPPEEILPAEVLKATPVPVGWTRPLGQPEIFQDNPQGRLPLGSKP